jgi:hypothetical protein
MSKDLSEDYYPNWIKQKIENPLGDLRSFRRTTNWASELTIIEMKGEKLT